MFVRNSVDFFLKLCNLPVCDHIHFDDNRSGLLYSYQLKQLLTRKYVIGTYTLFELYFIQKYVKINIIQNYIVMHIFFFFVEFWISYDFVQYNIMRIITTTKNSGLLKLQYSRTLFTDLR